VEYLQRTACANTPNDAGESAPEEDSVANDNACRLADTTLEALTALIDERTNDAPGDFRDREAEMLRCLNEVGRRWIEDELQRMADQYGDEVLVDGELYRRHSRGTREYHTLCGKVEVGRDTYRLVGVHNGPTVVPVELEAELFENATPALAFSVTQAFSKGPLRDYEAEMKAAHRSLPSRSTLERIGKRIGDRLRTALPRIELVVRALESIPSNACSISVGLDRTTVPMAERAEDKRTHRTKPYVRRPPDPVVVTYRMAYIATVAVHDANGDVLRSWRLAASAREGPGQLLVRLSAELRHLLEQRKLPLVVVQDGAPELWNLVDDWLARERLTAAAKLIDRYHVDERLAQIAEAVTYTQDGARMLYESWRQQLDRSDGAMARICRHLSDLEWWDSFGKADREPIPRYWDGLARIELRHERAQIVWGGLQYLKRYRRQMRYATAKRCGLAIGSGVTEGACKSVITMRCKRSGQRWFEQGLSPCLQLRTLHLNGRLQMCFELLATTRRRSLAAA